MTTFTEAARTGDFIVSEANGYRSREGITVVSGQDLGAGAVVGKITKGAATGAAVAGNTGDGTITAAPAVGAAAKVGVYRVVCIEPATDAGKFTVEDPDGITIGVATVAVEFTTHLTFTIADGAADFAAGDAFTITVAAGSGKYKEWNPSNTDGSHVAAGVLYAAVDASSADAAGVIVARDAEVLGSALAWFTGATSDNKTAGKAQLADLGIIAR